MDIDPGQVARERPATRPFRALALFGALLGLFCLGIALSLAGRRPDAVNLFFTADTQGFLVPCGCKTVPAGGLARRMAALTAFEEACRPEPVVAVEVTHGFADRCS